MKRKFFFWLERLQITPAERKAVGLLSTILVLLGSLNMALTPSVPFEEGHYRELEQQFRERTAMLEAKERATKKRYYPKLDAGLTAVHKDSLPDDHNQKVDDKPPKASAAKLINVNKADKKALQSLPGIGPTYARRIIKYRKEHKRFNTVEELKKIKGIGEKRLEKLKSFIKLAD